MTLYVQRDSDEKVVFSTDDFNCVPRKGETLMVRGSFSPNVSTWYKVVDVTYCFEHLTTMDSNSVTVWVKEL